MNDSDTTSGQSEFEQTATTVVRLGLVFLLLYWCYLIIEPFLPLVVWGAIIAVAIYPLHLKLAARLGNRLELSATLIMLLALAILITPVVILTDSLVVGLRGIAADLAAGTLEIPPPSESVQDWPFVGEPVYTAWLSASQNLTGTLAQYTPQLEGLRDGLIATAAGAGSGLVQLLFSVIIAGIFLATAEQSVAGTRAVINRLGGPGGERMLSVSEKTVRSVAQGVVGVAIFQAILAAIGLVVAGVPAAGLWSLLVLMLAIVQLSPLIILGPIIVYVFSVMDPFGATVFAIYSIIVSGSDTFLRPMLLRRGLDVPMIVILLGSIGGMILAGIVGLFVGAVILVLGYELVEFWINESDAAAESAAPNASP